MRQRILRHPVAGWSDPGIAFAALHGEAPNAFWLDGGAHAASGMSYIGAGNQVATGSVPHNTVTLAPGGHVFDGTIFDFLRGQPVLTDEAVRAPLGWVGWLGYELRTHTMPGHESATADIRPRVSRYPDAALLRIDRLVAFDHAAGSVHLIALGDAWSGELARWRDSTVASLAGLSVLSNPGRADTSDPLTPVAATAVRWRDSDEEYLAKIAACQLAIIEGEAYQLCLTTEVAVDVRPDPLATWLELRRASPSHHGGFLRIGDVSLLSSSPEQFLSLDSAGVLESRPIKGTRPRGANRADDDRLRSELAASEKERAENLMIVDLMRNDLGRVCEVGSVGVPSLLQVESYAQVHQLVSTVRGRLAADRGAIDAIEACFPAGSMTGAPKLRATELLDTLEARPRGLYSGAFGYVGFDGGLDLAMVIRSIVLDADGATIGTGGGITALSVPAEELAEMKLKAAALLRVLGV
ncbi:anthranilate/para-aminobenzoate synthase component I [Marisediminicola sp. UYEF4]|uniref:anthranilate synthase component I family protein n=1 Tax=Marisediminicola sp. UYEF4 TaxID=1756384 RepID=UPI003390F3AF